MEDKTVILISKSKQWKHSKKFAQIQYPHVVDKRSLSKKNELSSNQIERGGMKLNNCFNWLLTRKAKASLMVFNQSVIVNDAMSLIPLYLILISQ